MKALPRSIHAHLFGREAHRRLRVSQALVALVVYLVFAAVQQVEVAVGFIAQGPSNLLTAFNLLGAFGFYLAIRSGWSETLDDPAMTLPQMAWGVLATVGSYAITGPARGAVLTLLVLILVFGMFALAPAQTRRLTVLAVVLLGLVMLWKSQTQPLRYPPSVEATHFAFALVVLGSVTALSVRMGQLRARLKDQKQELQRALVQIQQLATQDELTGLVNRRHMRSLVVDAQRRACQLALPTCLVLLDLDHFKQVNDQHGHPVGDAVLQHFAQTCQSVLREGDVLARWGGEEFLLMLPGTSITQAEPLIERLRARLHSTPFQGVSPALRISFSAGVASLDLAPVQPLEQVIERADQALYLAKGAGRNCTVLG